MRFSLAAAAGLAALASAQSVAPRPSGNGTVSYTTEIVTAYTTYCPSPTVITHGTATYTVTKATTLTITNCPCTVTKPVTTSAPKPSGTAPGSKSPVPSGTKATTPVSSPSTSPITPARGAADKLYAGAGSFLAVVGLAAVL